MSTRIPNRPYNTKLITRATIKAEYLARGPFSTACYSNSPGVSENKVWDASSGRNGPPASDLMRSEIPMARAPATIPATKDLTYP
ncbi:MAG TPA: hypothetical protein VE177_04330 [Candidatus Binatus sp.]|nr:hypothetical protein [Candidatus Binatus sp.]